MKACEIAQIRKDIEQMPMGYHTELSDGAGLSGGQKQRSAFGRRWGKFLENSCRYLTVVQVSQQLLFLPRIPDGRSHRLIRKVLGRLLGWPRFLSP